MVETVVFKIKVVPLPAKNPPQEPEYQYQPAFTPVCPPKIPRVSLIPGQYCLNPVIESAGADDKFTETVKDTRPLVHNKEYTA